MVIIIAQEEMPIASHQVITLYQSILVQIILVSLNVLQGHGALKIGKLLVALESIVQIME